MSTALQVHQLNFLVVALWTGCCALRMLWPETFEGDLPSTLMRVLVVSVPSLLFLRWRRLPLDLWPVNWRAIGVGVGIVICYFAVGVLVFRPNAFILPTNPFILLNWSFATPIAEEILYRGITYRQLAQTTTHQRATLISAAWFLLLHVPRWIFLGRLGTASTIRFLLSVFVFGLLLPYLVRSTNSLWSAIAVHISNNFLGHAFR